jgi:methionyl-tRNA formyltransferase
MKIVYFGTPRFAADVLQYLLDNGLNVVAVVTKPDKPQGRSGTPVPTPVKVVAEMGGIPVLQPEIVSAPDQTPILEAFQADLFVVVAYGEIIKQHLLDMPKIACINVHASLLPYYRGAAPIQRSILNGEKETGITIMHMARKMDAGDVIAMEAVPIGANTTYGELESELCQVGSKLLLKTLLDAEKDLIPRVPQDHSQATFAPKIEIEDCQIHWDQPADTLHNLVRGVNPHPTAWCPVIVKGQHKRLKITTTTVTSTEGSDIPPGQIIASSRHGLQVSCGRGILNLLQVQLEGKKSMSADEFMRGHPSGSLQFLTP